MNESNKPILMFLIDFFSNRVFDTKIVAGKQEISSL